MRLHLFVLLTAVCFGCSDREKSTQSPKAGEAKRPRGPPTGSGPASATLGKTCQSDTDCTDREECARAPRAKRSTCFLPCYDTGQCPEGHTCLHATDGPKLRSSESICLNWLTSMPQ